MAELSWGAASPSRVLAAVAVTGFCGVLPTIQDWGHPLLLAPNLIFGSYLVLVALRDGRLTTSGDQLRVSSALRAGKLVRARDIAGIVRSTEMPWTLMIWTLDGRFIRVAPAREGFRVKNHVQRRLDEVETWFVEHRGPDWSLDSLRTTA